MARRLVFTQGHLFHMTLIERLPAIVASGAVLSDTTLGTGPLPGEDIAHEHLKARRRRRSVPVDPGGTVADYVPFYLAPRSPMLFANARGGVEGRSSRQDGIIYLVTSIELLAAAGPVVLTDRHLLRRGARFTNDRSMIDDPAFIVWDVMFDPYFTPTETDTERPDRRQAEVLAHACVPLDRFLGVAARTETELDRVRDCTDGTDLGWHHSVRPDWYFDR